MTIRLGVCALAMLVLAAVPARADDVADKVREAMELYEAGNYGAAAGMLDFAAQLIRQKKGEQVAAYFPEPLSGWSADEPESQAAGAAFFGGGLSAERSYRRGREAFAIRIISDSPLMQSLMMMFANPAILASSGGQLKVIAGQQAMIQKDGSSATVSVVVANRMLIQVEGAAPLDAMIAHLEAMDFKALASLT